MLLHRGLDLFSEVDTRFLLLLFLGLTAAASCQFVQLVSDLILPEHVHQELLLLHELPAVFLVRK